MSNDKVYGVELNNSGNFRLATQTEIDEAIKIRDKRKHLQNQIKVLQEELELLTKTAYNENKVFYDSSSFIYTTRHFIASGNSYSF